MFLFFGIVFFIVKACYYFHMSLFGSFPFPYFEISIGLTLFGVPLFFCMYAIDLLEGKKRHQEG